MTNRLFLALVCALLAVRLPSLVQPMGADEGLYAYIGDRIRAGGMPYVDAWDQKPPAIHVTYAAMRAALPADAAVPAADLLMAAVVAAALYGLGSGLADRGTGQAAALLFLFLSNPAFARLAGVSVRAQCETFIAAAVACAFLLLARSRDGTALVKIAGAGVLFGLAFTFKYNAAVYTIAGVAALWLWNRLTAGGIAALAAGFALPVFAFVAWFAVKGALPDVYGATVAYNLAYSGETYAGPLHAAVYLLTFPIRHARVDALWLLGGAGCAVLLVAAWRTRTRLFPVIWVAAACLSIAINGSRDLPQYFIQAAPALALAAAWAGTLMWTRWRIVNAVAMILLSIAVWRVNEFSNLAENTWHDARYVAGRTTRAQHLARYGDRTQRKYSALANAELGEFMRSRTGPDDRVYVFGFSCGAYVEANRVSASRFFWSRPVIAGFYEGRPGYGVAGLLADLQRNPPAVVALQLVDWIGDVGSSAHFFLSTPPLADWLHASYERVKGPDGFDVFVRRQAVQ